MAKPLLPSDFVSGSHARGTGEVVMSGNSPRILLLHIRRILRGGYIAWRILHSGTLKSPAGRSFDPSAEGALTTARPPLPLIICPCLPLLSTDYCLSSCCHTLRRCSLTVRTLCLHREVGRDPTPLCVSKVFLQLNYSGGVCEGSPLT